MRSVVNVSSNVVVNVRRIAPVLQLYLAPTVKLRVDRAAKVALLVVRIEAVNVGCRRRLTVAMVNEKKDVDLKRCLVRFLRRVLVVIATLNEFFLLRGMVLVDLFSRGVSGQVVKRLITSGRNVRSNFPRNYRGTFLVGGTLGVLYQYDERGRQGALINNITLHNYVERDRGALHFKGREVNVAEVTVRARIINSHHLARRRRVRL